MSKPLVLIIEDDKEVAELYRHALELSGVETEIIRIGEDALTRLAAIVPNIVLLDLKLSPHMSGAYILHYIRSDQRLAKTCVIVITGYAVMADAVKEQADLVLIKPVDVGQLIDLVARFLSSDAGDQRLNASTPQN